MSRMVAALVAAGVGLGVGVWAQSQFRWFGGEGASPTSGGGEREILYWVAPMNPSYRRDEPGKSPMGMDLVPVYADEAADSGDEVRISPVVENNLGVRTTQVTAGPLWRRVDATGYVALDETKIAHVHLRSQGWIERLMIEAEGERVRKGDVLLELYSPEVVNAQKEYLLAKRRSSNALLAAAEEKLRALGVTTDDIAQLERRGTSSDTMVVVAPQDGVVTALNVREGMHVMPGTTLMSLADLSTVWLNAEVFESQVDWVAEHQPAEASLSFLPGEVFEGSVDYVYPVLDPRARTLKVRLRFDNPGERLKPNMYARVSLFGGPKYDVLSVPREALIRSGKADRLVVALGEGRFRVHEVETGIETGGWVEILRGIDEGATIVTSAQFLIDSEASLSGSVRRLSELDAQESSDPIMGVGVVRSIEGSLLTLEHERIEALGWPAMTMDFVAAPHADVSGVVEGMTIHFTLESTADGGHQIGMVHIVTDEPTPPEHAHD